MKLLLQPLPVRIFHWVMAVCVFVLLATGLSITATSQLLLVSTRFLRKLHILAGYILAANLAGQIYYYIYTTKYTEIVFLPRDWRNMRSFSRYVLFITDSHPNFGRYNPGQKLLFSAWFLTVFLATVSGIALLSPDSFLVLQRFLGGLTTIRILHFGVAVFFCMSIPLHLYLVFTESPAHLQAMFTGYVNKEPAATPPKPGCYLYDQHRLRRIQHMNSASKARVKRPDNPANFH